MTRADRAIQRIREADRHGRPSKCPICGTELRGGGRVGRMMCRQRPSDHGGYVAQWGRWRRCDYSYMRKDDNETRWDPQRDQFGIAEKRETPAVAWLAGVLAIWILMATAVICWVSDYNKTKIVAVHTKPTEVWITGKVRTTFSMSFNDEKYRLNPDSTVTFRDVAYDTWLTLPVSQVERFPKGSDEPPR